MTPAGWRPCCCAPMLGIRAEWQAVKKAEKGEIEKGTCPSQRMALASHGNTRAGEDARANLAAET